MEGLPCARPCRQALGEVALSVEAHSPEWEGCDSETHTERIPCELTHGVNRGAQRKEKNTNIRSQFVKRYFMQKIFNNGDSFDLA